MEMKFTSTMESVYDGKTYCWSNGQFNRHLVSHNTNFEEYYATYITGVVPVCPYCFKPRKFYQKKLSYIETCGASQCISKRRLEMHANMPEEQRAAISKKRVDIWAARTNAEKAAMRVKRTATNLERYGSVAPAGNAEVRQRAQATCLERYGVPYPGQSEEVRQSMKETLMTRYGVEHQMHIPDVVYRVSRSVMRNCYGDRLDKFTAENVARLYEQGGIIALENELEITNSKAYSLLRDFGISLTATASIFEQRVYNYIERKTTRLKIVWM